MLKPLQNQIPSRQASQSSMRPLPSKSAERLKLASANTQKMLRAFPDYGKSPPEYVAAIVALMAEYPAHIQDKLADTRFGVPSKTEFLPTPKIITELAEAYLRHERELADYDRRFSRQPIKGQQPRAPHRPFPQLWAEFGDEYMDAKARRISNFETLDAACKALVTQGRHAALKVMGETTEQSEAA